MNTADAEMWSSEQHETTCMDEEPARVVERWLDTAVLSTSCTLTVYGWRHAVLPDDYPDAEEVVDKLMMELDAEYGGDNDNDYESITAQGRSILLGLAQALCAGVRDEYVPGSYERVLGCSIQYRVWLEDGIPRYELLGGGGT